MDTNKDTPKVPDIEDFKAEVLVTGLSSNLDAPINLVDREDRRADTPGMVKEDWLEVKRLFGEGKWNLDNCPAGDAGQVFYQLFGEKLEYDKEKRRLQEALNFRRASAKARAFYYHVNGGGDLCGTVCLVFEEGTGWIARGVALRSHLDQFSRKRGREIAFGRAFKALELGEPVGKVRTEQASDVLNRFNYTEACAFGNLKFKGNVYDREMFEPITDREEEIVKNAVKTLAKIDKKATEDESG